MELETIPKLGCGEESSLYVDIGKSELPVLRHIAPPSDVCRASPQPAPAICNTANLNFSNAIQHTYSLMTNFSVIVSPVLKTLVQIRSN
jgi:hypothetical protein